MNIFNKITNNYRCKETEGIEQPDIKSSISKDDLQKLYMVEYKSQAYASYYNTSMEKDKSILTLSVAGIGFLVTLIKLESSIELYQLFIFVIAAVSFLVSIYSVVTLFGKNADFVIDLTNERDVTLKQHELKILDRNAIYAFYLAILMSLALGVSTSSSLIKNGDIKMSKEEDKIIEQVQNGELELGFESFQGIADVKKSFSSAEQLNPSQNNNQQTTNQNTQGAAAMMPTLPKDEK